jgi:hypothetical protein
LDSGDDESAGPGPGDAHLADLGASDCSLPSAGPPRVKAVGPIVRFQMEIGRYH